MTQSKYTLENREAAVAAVDAGERVSDVAARLGIHPDTLRNWLRLREKTGSVRGRKMKLAKRDLDALLELCWAHPDATNEEMVDLLEKACGIRVVEKTIWTERRRLGFERVRVPRPARNAPTAATGTPGGYKGGGQHDGGVGSEGGRKRYPSDLTDAQWELIEPFLPPAKLGGRLRSVDRREVVNAILYLLRTGCPWRSLPHDFPCWSTVHYLFRQWRNAGVWERANAAFRERVRKRDGREPTPSAASIDSQSVKTTEKGGPVASMGGRR